MNTADVCLLVDDVEQVVAFYRDMLGFEIAVEGPVFARFEATGFVLAVWQKATMAAHTGIAVAPAAAGSFVGLPLETPEEVDRLHDRLSIGGARIEVAPRNFPWGARCTFFRDPAGHLWEAYAWNRALSSASAGAPPGPNSNNKGDKDMTRFKLSLATSTLMLASTLPALSAETVSVVLNWTVGADHAPLYWAKKEGLYEQAGIDLNIEIGKGSAYAAQRVGVNAAQFGIVDMPTAMQARGEGADLVGVMVIYETSPYTIYWKKSSGIKTIADLPGRKIGTPPADAARQMWPAIAKQAGIDPNSVSWVNVAPDAKFAALQSGAIDVTTNFYNIHFVGERIFGDDLGYLRLADIGFNPYGNSFFANAAYAKEHTDLTRNFVQVTQKAYAACAKAPKPCLQAVTEAASQSPEDLAASWALVADLMAGPTGDVFGAFKPERVAKDYETITTTFGTKPYPYETMFTNEYLDTAIKN